MTDAVEVALIAAAPGTLSVIIGAVVYISTQKVAKQALLLRQQSATEHADTIAKVDKVAVIADQSAVKADSLLEKTIEIHTATNGNLAILKDQVSTAAAEISGLKSLIATMTQAKTDAQVKDLQMKLEQQQPKK